MKVIYTEAAQQQFLEFQDRQKKFLEALISARKSVPGDDTLEVTASDIKEWGSYIRPIAKSARPLQMARMLSVAYVLIGVAMAVVAVNYSKLIRLFKDSPDQAALLIAGASISLAGLMMNLYLRMKEKRNKEQFERVRYLERYKEQKDDEPPESRLLLPPDQYMYTMLSRFLMTHPAFRDRRFVLESRDGKVMINVLSKTFSGPTTKLEYEFALGPDGNISSELHRLQNQILKDIVTSPDLTPK